MLKGSKYTISFIVDSRFFPDLIDKYKRSDLIVINVVRYNGKGGKKLDVDHLNLEDVKRIIKGIKPKQAILTHFGMTLVRSKPWKIAAEIEKEIGIKTGLFFLILITFYFVNIECSRFSWNPN